MRFLLLFFLFITIGLSGQTSNFPAFKAFDLNKNEISIPEEIYAEKTLLIVPFKQKQQTAIYDFLDEIDYLLNNYNNFDFLEIPTISYWWQTMQLSNWIDNGMRSGITDFETRKRTITRYIDVNEFLEEMEIPDRSEVCYYLINKNGEILWQHRGKANKEAMKTLEHELAATNKLY